MRESISHDRSDESFEAKVRWFQSLTVEERMELLDEFTDLVWENNPEAVRRKNAQIPRGRVQVLGEASSEMPRLRRDRLRTPRQERLEDEG